jgi:hypothetical protein
MEKNMGKPVIKPYRNELKYTFSNSEYYIILRKLGKLNFHKYHNFNYVNNVYFDNENSFFDDNVEGLSNRTKCRIRWYGKSDSNNLINLELKIKKGKVGKKVVYNLKTKDFRDINSIQREVLKISLEHNLQIHQLKPNVQNQYHREYFVNNNVRMTLDTKIMYSNYNIITSPIFIADRNVLELKFDIDSNPDLTFLDDLNLKLERNSKYVNGLNLTGNINLNFN